MFRRKARKLDAATGAKHRHGGLLLAEGAELDAGLFDILGGHAAFQLLQARHPAGQQAFLGREFGQGRLAGALFQSPGGGFQPGQDLAFLHPLAQHRQTNAAQPIADSRARAARTEPGRWPDNAAIRDTEATINKAAPARSSRRRRS